MQVGLHCTGHLDTLLLDKVSRVCLHRYVVIDLFDSVMIILTLIVACDDRAVFRVHEGLSEHVLARSCTLRHTSALNFS